MIDDHPLAALFRRWSGHSDLSPADREALLSLPFTRKNYSARTPTSSAKGADQRMRLMLKGFAFRQKLLRDGSRQIISFHIPTEFVDLQNSLLGMADHSVQSLDRCEVAVVPKRALMQIADARPAARGWRCGSTRLIDASIFREWVVNVGRRDSRARIAHLLCELALRLQDRRRSRRNDRFSDNAGTARRRNRPDVGPHQPHACSRSARTVSVS